ncbi:MAG: DALR domain-containing protein, partial [Bacteroidia bacterium]
DFSNEALQASEKGFERLMDSYKTLQSLTPGASSTEDIKALQTKCYEAMNDDFNTPVLIAHLFEAVRIINSVNDKKASLTQADLDLLKNMYQHFLFDVMGLKLEAESNKTSKVLDKVVHLVLDLRNKAKSEKNFPLSDEIRNKLTDAGVQVKDSKEGSTWKI